MTWTYSGDPSTSDLDQVRFLCGDTDEAYSFLSDEEINFLMTDQKNLRRVAIKAIEQIVTKLAASSVDYTIGPESVKASQRMANFARIKRLLQQDLRAGLAFPIMTQAEEPPCRPLFNIGMHDNGVQ
ncbi:hypothetical protein D3C75_843710 [compost metagenome]